MLQFDPAALTVQSEDGVVAKLTRKEFEILSCLIKALPSGISPDDLRKQVWGNLAVVDKSLDVHLFKLRKKLAPLRYQVRLEKNYCYLLVHEEE